MDFWQCVIPLVHSLPLTDDAFYFSCYFPSLKRRPAALAFQVFSFKNPLGIRIYDDNAGWFLLFNVVCAEREDAVWVRETESDDIREG